MTMPWGKFRGRHIADVPSSYLVWLIETVTDADEILLSSIRDELADRLGLEPIRVPVLTPPPPELRPLITEMLRQGYRAAARQAHPDTGGSTPGMQRLNDAREWARAQGLL